MPASCPSTQAILLSNEITSEEGLPEMPLQPQLINPCSKALYIIHRAELPECQEV